ncbi:MAG: biotin/lipoyl-containing protein [Porphyromonas endodontalis]
MKEFKYKINGNEYAVKLNKLEEKEAEVEVNGTTYQVELLTEKKETPRPVVKRVTPVVSAPKASAPSAGGGSKGGIKAPLPGVILDVVVKVGDVVKRGQKVAVLEAMKMENNINSDREGKVLEVKVQKGESILEGTDIVVIG